VLLSLSEQRCGIGRQLRCSANSHTFRRPERGSAQFTGLLTTLQTRSGFKVAED
jgi:hypothetical protein